MGLQSVLSTLIERTYAKFGGVSYCNPEMLTTLNYVSRTRARAALFKR